MVRSAMRLLLVPAAVLAVAALPAQAQNKPQLNHIKPFVVGGTDAKIAEFPYQVGLSIARGQVTYRCGGTLIRSDWVLTAAHCFVVDDTTGRLNTDAAGVEARTGNSTLADGDRTPAIKIIVHENYNHATHVNDVALVQLGDVLTKTPSVVLDGSGVVKEGTDVTVVGWGRTAENGSLSPTLMKATVKVISNANCNIQQSYDGKITAGMLSAGFEGGAVDACQGDSGGPLLRRDGPLVQQVGIVSWGEGCARPHKYTVYTRVSTYRDWILDKSFSRIYPPPPPDADPDCFLRGNPGRPLPYC